MHRSKKLLILILLPALLSSCFTGIESTPKITLKDAGSRQNVAASPEDELAATFSFTPFSRWSEGKQLFVTSPRISLALSTLPGSTAEMPQKGDTITFAGTHTSVSLTGEEVVELLLIPQHSADTLVYRTNATADELKKRSTDAVPFTVDLDFIRHVGEALTGKTLFIKTPLWHDRSGRQVAGRKFVAVKVVDILPANEVNPAMVVFTDDAGAEHAVFMAPGGESKSTPRTFSSLFSFTDPRRAYPGIKDAVWNDIVHSRAAAGMTKTEAMLAMGAPTSIDRGHNHSATYERWSYPDGIYLIFEDGLLVRFNR